jgi:hypothetical protein
MFLLRTLTGAEMAPATAFKKVKEEKWNISHWTLKLYCIDLLINHCSVSMIYVCVYKQICLV